MSSILSFFKNKIPSSSHGLEARKVDRDEFLHFQKTIHHGFPAKSSCMDFDPELNLLAIGTKNGLINIYGSPGVEFNIQQPDYMPVLQVIFIPNEGRLVSRSEDHSLYLWEINSKESNNMRVSSVDLAGSLSTADIMKPITAACRAKFPKNWSDTTPENTDDSTGDTTTEFTWSILLGTESGNVYRVWFDDEGLKCKDLIIFEEAVKNNVPDFKENPGPVESLCWKSHRPADIIVGYNRGLIVIWNITERRTIRSYITPYGVQDVEWHPDGDKVISAHTDSSYAMWSSEDSSQPLMAPVIPFGPFPCKPLDRLRATKNASGEELWVFSGAMPRASYGDKFAVTIERKSDNSFVVLDFSSRIWQFLLLENEERTSRTLLVLCEQELVAIDLDKTPDPDEIDELNVKTAYPPIRLPYLLPLHASPVTACVFAQNVSPEIHETLREVGCVQAAEKFGLCSERQWPILGGNVPDKESDQLPISLLISGHEDGSVKFWNVSDTFMQLIYMLPTAILFEGHNDDTDLAEDDQEEIWPPFKKVGLYDPYSDDPRFAVQRLFFDSSSGILAVGGTAGQISVWQLGATDEENKMRYIVPEPINVSLVGDGQNFKWKGNERLTARTGHPVAVDFRPLFLGQVDPPAAITALAVDAKTKLLAMGTAHGFCLLDYGNSKLVHSKCLLTAEDIASHDRSAMEQAMNRFKSFKKSLRQSFRRRRRNRSPQPAGKNSPPIQQQKKTKREQLEGKHHSPSDKIEEFQEKLPAESKEEHAAATTSEGRDSSPSKLSSSRGSPARRDKMSPSKMVSFSTPTDKEREDIVNVAPVEREIKSRDEQRATGDVMPSLVRCLLFANTQLTTHAAETELTLWVGTNGGQILAHTISTNAKTKENLSPAEENEQKIQPEGDNVENADVVQDEPIGAQEATVDDQESFTCRLAKQIQLQHGAPVLGMWILDRDGKPIKDVESKTVGATPATTGPVHHFHRLVVASEEQMKSFHLPTLRAGRHKYKLTGTEGSRIRKTILTVLKSKSDETKEESFVVVMTNQGEVEAFSIRNFKRYLRSPCTVPQDVHGVLSTVLTVTGEGFYLEAGGSEWQRFTVSACQNNVLRPNRCWLELADNMRPKKQSAPISESRVAEEEEQRNCERR